MQVLVSRDMEHLSEVIIFMVVRIKSIPKRKQVWDAVRGAAARGMILGLDSAWASSTWVDSQGRLQEGQQPSDGDVGMPAAAAAAPKVGSDCSLLIIDSAWCRTNIIAYKLISSATRDCLSTLPVYIAHAQPVASCLAAVGPAL
jgi:hypothetical protein